MKKLLFIILGGDSVNLKSFLNDVSMEIFGDVILASRAEPSEILAQTMEFLLDKTKGNPENALALYSGENLNLLKDNLPRETMDLKVYFENLKQKAGGYETIDQKRLVQETFIQEIKLKLGKE